MRKNIVRLATPVVAALGLIYFLGLRPNSNETHYPTKYEEEEENPDKLAKWTPEQAARHQEQLKRLGKVNTTRKLFSNDRGVRSMETSNGWTHKGPYNMPGAFKMAEMLDGTDTIYGVTLNHYSAEYNATSYIFRGTVYNPTKGSGGDDFELLTPDWPNRYDNLFAFKVGSQTRLVAHIENGPLYYSDDEGENWIQSTGLPAVNKSAAINRQDNHRIYVTDGKDVFVSTNNGTSFALLQSFGSNQSSALYTPRYAAQPDAGKVYLARGGSFYTLNASKTEFSLLGTYNSGNTHNEKFFSIGGDSRKLYITVDDKFWASSNQGQSWTQKYPPGNYYGDKSGTFPPGLFLAVNPENENNLIGGYTVPIVSVDGLDNTISDHANWGNYQNGNNLGMNDYYNRIRFNYHPDFQSCHFFYNSSGTLFSVRCSDGGLFISFKEWYDINPAGQGPDVAGYAGSHYINLNTLNTGNALVYRQSVICGKNSPNHIAFATQDQGSQSIISTTANGDGTLNFYQSVGGDGPSVDCSYDGTYAWRFRRDRIHAPTTVYNGSNQFKSAAQIISDINALPSQTFTESTQTYWARIVIDHTQPGNRAWVLTKNLNKADWNGSNLSVSTVDKGDKQVAALAQAWGNSDKLFMLQGSQVYISTNGGNSFGNGISTPFSITSKNWPEGDIGSGVVLPNNDNWILFCGPSNNDVGAILSKDGGSTWVDVTGNFPAGFDVQTGGMVVTPDSKYVVAGTDIGAYLFDVATETWYSLANGIGYFNATDVDYIPSTNVVRFGTWGLGILDYDLDEFCGPPAVAFEAQEICPGDEVYLATEISGTSGSDYNVSWSNGFVPSCAGVLEQSVDLVPADADVLLTDLCGSNSGKYFLELEFLTNCYNTTATFKGIVDLDANYLEVLEYKHFNETQASSMTRESNTALVSGNSAYASIKVWMSGNKVFFGSENNACGSGVWTHVKSGSYMEAQLIQPLTSETYTATVFKDSGCEGIGNYTVTVNPGPSLEAEPLEICAGDEMLLTAVINGDAGDDYSIAWSHGFTSSCAGVFAASLDQVPADGDLLLTNLCGSNTGKYYMELEFLTQCYSVTASFKGIVDLDANYLEVLEYVHFNDTEPTAMTRQSNTSLISGSTAFAAVEVKVSGGSVYVDIESNACGANTGTRVTGGSYMLTQTVQPSESITYTGTIARTSGCGGIGSVVVDVNPTNPDLSNTMEHDIDGNGFVAHSSGSQVIAPVGSTLKLRLPESAYSGSLVWTAPDGTTYTDEEITFANLVDEDNTVEGNWTVDVSFAHACGPTAQSLSFEVVVDNTVSVDVYGSGALTVYPVPAQGNVMITAPAVLREAHVTLRDIQGKLVYQKLHQASNGTVELNVEGLESGTYFLELEDQHQHKFTGRVVKK